MAEVAAFEAELGALPPRELVRFDELSRSWLSGLSPDLVAQLQQEPETAPRLRLQWMLGFVSRSGYERAAAISVAPEGPLTSALVALRAVDWVMPVRLAALRRLAEGSRAQLLDALPMAARLVGERSRAGELDALLERELTDTDWRTATRSSDVVVRRAAWHRLAAHRAISYEELTGVLLLDSDVLVRAVAAEEMLRRCEAERLAIARTLIDDPIGWLASRALEVLIAHDGDLAVERALFGRSPSLRRAARGWASLRGIDSRARYLERLSTDDADPVALSALCEIADRRDADVFRDGATRSPRANSSGGAARTRTRGA